MDNREGLKVAAVAVQTLVFQESREREIKRLF